MCEPIQRCLAVAIFGPVARPVAIVDVGFVAVAKPEDFADRTVAFVAVCKRGRAIDCRRFAFGTWRQYFDERPQPVAPFGQGFVGAVAGGPSFAGRS